MSRTRHNTPGISLRLRSIREMIRNGEEPRRGPGRDCTGSPLGERLGIAALYAGRGDEDNARAAALLVCAGITDTPDNRSAVIDAFGGIRAAVLVAVGISNAPGEHV